MRDDGQTTTEISPERREAEIPPERRDVIVASWGRSAAAGLGRGAARFRQVPAAELTMRLNRSAALIGAAAPFLDLAIERVVGRNAAAYIVDTDGIVLDSRGDPAQIVLFGLSPGYDWSERAMGTNGAGTALATGRPVAVIGPEHFLQAFANCTCTAAPIRGPDGGIVGAIDISSGGDEAEDWRIDFVVSLAEAIGAALRRAA
jgi:transcriptional regulator of acetoin/glycerol metabolism